MQNRCKKMYQWAKHCLLNGKRFPTITTCKLWSLCVVANDFAYLKKHENAGGPNKTFDYTGLKIGMQRIGPVDRP